MTPCDTLQISSHIGFCIFRQGWMTMVMEWWALMTSCGCSVHRTPRCRRPYIPRCRGHGGWSEGNSLGGFCLESTVFYFKYYQIISNQILILEVPWGFQIQDHRTFDVLHVQVQCRHEAWQIVARPPSECCPQADQIQLTPLMWMTVMSSQPKNLFQTVVDVALM